MPAPVFISLDGIDGTGKSTQCRLLADRLRGLGLSVTTCTDPGGTEVGAKLREILLHGHQTRIGSRTEALLFMASRAELVEQVIRPALGRGDVVVSDRYLLANVVYQGHAGGLDPADLWEVGMFSTGDLLPDLTLVLDLTPESARHRRGRAADRMESRGEDHDERVRSGFLAEAAARPDRVRLIDAGPSVEDVHAVIAREVDRVLAANGYPVP